MSITEQDQQKSKRHVTDWSAFLYTEMIPPCHCPSENQTTTDSRIYTCCYKLFSVCQTKPASSRFSNAL